jgi:TP901 family phage tail tape measure protein
VAERSLRFDLLVRDQQGSRVLGQFGGKVDRFGRDTSRKFERAGDESGRRFSTRFSKRLGGGFSVATGLATKAAGAIGLAFAAAGVAKFAKDSVALAATFDKTMRQVATVAKVPTGQIAKLREVALDMGAKTSFSAKQASEAMLELAKGGLSAAQIKAGGLKATLTLAAAGGIELGQAAGFVVKSLGQFGLKVDKAADVAAALAGGANASTASVEDLGEALSQVGPGARNAGFSLQQTVGVLAAFSDNGIRGSDAGTSLKTMLVSLVPTTDKAARTMRKLGLDFTDAHGAIIPVTQIAQQLQDRLGKLSQAQRIAALQTIFGSDATRAATVLMQQGAGGLAKYIKATNDRGAAEKLAKSNTEGAAGAFERLRGAIETVQIRVGTALLPMLADAAEGAARLADKAGDLFTRFTRDLRPELDRVRVAWDDNRSSILGFATSLDASQSSMGTTKDAAVGLADALEQLIQKSGQAADAGGKVGAWLTRQDAQLDVSGSKIHDKLIAPITSATLKFGEFFGLRPIGPLQGIAEHLTSTTAQLATNTSSAASAAQRHATAMREQKAAMDALTGALDTEKGAELNLRQAKLNVSTAQGRLNELKKAGKTRSTEYKQAQINLERAHLAAKEASTLYRTAVVKSNEAERIAASRAAATRAALETLRATSIGARKRLVQFALDSSAAIKELKSRSLKVTANYNIGAPKGIELLIEKGLVRKATGGPIAGPGTATSDSVPAMLSTGEHVWSAKEVKGAGGHRAVEQMRQRARGMAAGGPVLKVDQTGTAAFLGRPGRFDANMERSLAAAARGFAALVRQNKESIFGVGKAAVKAFIRSTDPLPYVWGGAGPGGYDCSGLVSAVLGKHTGRGGGHGQRYFSTSSISAGILGLKPGLGGTLQIGVTPSRGHMAGRYGGLGFEAESTRTGIKIGSAASRPEGFARHFHLAKGGRIDQEMLARFALLTGADIGGDAGRTRINGKVFDRGGWLMPGATLAVNRTGRPEPVGTAGRLSRADARMIAEELAKVIPTTVSVDDIHTGLRAKRGRNRVGLGLG